MVAAQRMCKRCGNVPPIDGEKFCANCKKLTLTELREALGPIHTRTIYDSGAEYKGRKTRGARLIGHLPREDEE
jgi:molybdenum cofactor biosynthesis enzyme MoaA